MDHDIEGPRKKDYCEYFLKSFLYWAVNRDLKNLRC